MYKRQDIFLERAIVEERVRLAMGLPTRRMDEPVSYTHLDVYKRQSLG